MDSDYRNRLTPEILQLLDGIERFAGLEVTVELGSPPTTDSATADGNYSVVVTPDSATIYIPSAYEFRLESVLHELLHVQRFWVEGVPRLTEIFQTGRFRTMLDNSLEHLIIVPRAAKYGVDPFPYWNAMFRALLAKFPTLTDQAQIAREAKIVYASLHRVVNDDDLIAEWRRTLEAAGQLDAARSFWEKLEPTLDEKRAMLRLVFSELALNDLIASIKLIDVRARAERPLNSWDL